MMRRRGGILALFYLLSFLLFFAGCEQPSGNAGPDTQAANNGGNGNNDDDDDDGGYQGIPGFGEPEEAEPQINGVVIYAYPHITYFAKGQAFSYEGLELKYIYDTGDYGRTLVDKAEYEVEAIDTDALAPPVKTRTKTVTIAIKTTAEGAFSPVTYTVRIDSSTSILTNITMTHGPNKTDYTLGEEFSTDGIEVEGVYSGGDRDGERVTVPGTVAASGYNKHYRGRQTVTFKLNGATLGTADVTVKVPAGAAVTLNYPHWGTTQPQIASLRNIQIKGRAYTAAYSRIAATVKAGGQTYILTTANGTVTDADLSGYDPYTPGNHTVTVNLDGNTARFPVYTADVEAEVWFDYGYRRTAQDPRGTGPGAGAYYAKPGETLVLSPVRFLLGYDDDHKDTGVSYTWSVISGPSSYTKTTPSDGEFCYFTPTAAGTYRIRVEVSGRDYVSGGNVTKSAETDAVCYTGNVGVPAGKTYKPPMKDFAPGQQNEGVGYGWSLGSALGYEVWSLPNGAAKLEIHGNPFSGWSEAGIVWVQYDANGNGIPDETWYELRGSDDDDATWKPYITRRYAVRYIRAPTPAYFRWDGTRYVYNAALDTDGLEPKSDGLPITRPVLWVDAKGRAASMSGWPYGAGLSDEAHTYAVYSGTILRDNGVINDGAYNLAYDGYVDTGSSVSGKYPYATFNAARDAIRADGSPANLDPDKVRFVKVQTALFQYAQIFGNVSTEIVYGTNLPNQSNGFAMPEGGYE